MKYQVIYTGTSENSATLAHGIANGFYDEEIILTDIDNNTINTDSDVNVVCFEFVKGNLPIYIMDALEELEGKTIICAVPCNFVPQENHSDSADSKISPFLPDNCDYKGTYLCMGQLPYDMYEKAQKIISDAPDHEHADKAQHIFDFYEASKGHPNDDDFADAIEFIRNQIN